MTDIAAYTPDTAKMILEVVEFLRRSGFVREAGRKIPQVFSDTPVLFRNDSGETVPPFACLQVTGAVDSDGRNYLTASKPTDATSEAGAYVFNGFHEVLTGEYGVCQPHGVVRAISDDHGGDAGMSYRPIVNDFRIELCPGPFMMIGLDDIGEDCIRVMHSPTGRGKAKWIVCTLNAEGTLTDPTVDEYWEGEDPEKCEAVTLVDPLGMPCPLKGQKVLCCYRPETDDYALISTKSALMGAPEDKNVVIGLGSQNCDISYMHQTIKTWTCEAEPEVDYVGLPITQVPVVTGLGVTHSGIHVSHGFVYVCGFSSGASTHIPFTECEEPEPECDGYCTWKWQGETWEDPAGEWLLTEECEGECVCATPLYPPQNSFDTTRTHDCGKDAPAPPVCSDSSCIYMWTKNEGDTFAEWDDTEAVWYKIRSCPNGCECTAAPANPPADANADLYVSYPCDDPV